MYLSKGMHDFDNRFFAMAGVFPLRDENDEEATPRIP